MVDDDLLTGRAAVVVGGSRGIGREVSALLAQRGAAVVINGRDAGAVQHAAEAITRTGGQALGHPGSPASEDAAEELVQYCVSEFGRIDILVNCAGTPEPPGSSILDISTEQFAELLEAHLWTVFQTCRAATPTMVKQGGGTIINTGSLAFRGDYAGTGYPAAKGAVTSLTMAIAAELKAQRVRANVVCPGAKTRMSSGPDYEAHISGLHQRAIIDDAAKQISLNAPPPEYAAPIYAYLASDLAADVTGQIFIAAGGFVGRFDRPEPSVLGYRDHADAPPWSVTDIHQMVTGERRP